VSNRTIAPGVSFNQLFVLAWLAKSIKILAVVDGLRNPRKFRFPIGASRNLNDVVPIVSEIDVRLAYLNESRTSCTSPVAADGVVDARCSGVAILNCGGTSEIGLGKFRVIGTCDRLCGVGGMYCGLAQASRSPSHWTGVPRSLIALARKCSDQDALKREVDVERVAGLIA